MKYLSKHSAIAAIKKIFSNTPDDDEVSLNDAFLAFGRDITKIKENKDWLSNKMTHLKYHDLIVPVYSFESGYRTLSKLRLTLEGKRSLGRIEGNAGNNVTAVFDNKNGYNRITLEDIIKAIPKIQKENPDFTITFSVVPKEEK